MVARTREHAVLAHKNSEVVDVHKALRHATIVAEEPRAEKCGSDLVAACNPIPERMQGADDRVWNQETLDSSVTRPTKHHGKTQEDRDRHILQKVVVNTRPPRIVQVQALLVPSELRPDFGVASVPILRILGETVSPSSHENIRPHRE